MDAANQPFGQQAGNASDNDQTTIESSVIIDSFLPYV